MSNTINILRLKVGGSIIDLFVEVNRSLKRGLLLLPNRSKQSQFLSISNGRVEIAVIKSESITVLLDSFLLRSKAVCEDIDIFEDIFFAIFNWC